LFFLLAITVVDMAVPTLWRHCTLSTLLAVAF
jgi:hypothetical protein